MPNEALLIPDLSDSALARETTASETALESLWERLIAVAQRSGPFAPVFESILKLIFIIELGRTRHPWLALAKFDQRPKLYDKSDLEHHLSGRDEELPMWRYVAAEHELPRVRNLPPQESRDLRDGELVTGIMKLTERSNFPLHLGRCVNHYVGRITAIKPRTDRTTLELRGATAGLLGEVEEFFPPAVIIDSQKPIRAYVEEALSDGKHQRTFLHPDFGLRIGKQLESLPIQTVASEALKHLYPAEEGEAHPADNLSTEQAEHIRELFNGRNLLSDLFAITVSWPSTNRRRADLIRKDVRKTITPTEMEELAKLESLADLQIALESILYPRQPDEIELAVEHLQREVSIPE